MMDETRKYIAREYGTTLVVLEEMEATSIQLDSRYSWGIGRAAAGSTVDIPLRSPIASRRHGAFMRFDDGWYYVDDPQNLNGTYYNGRKIPRPAPGSRSRVKLRNGDVLRIDNEDLSNPDSRGVWMLFTTDVIGGQWQFYSLEGKREVRIGRDSQCELCQPVNYLSRIHARILPHNGQYYVQDCNSTAGTWVNNRRVEGTQLLREKDTIALCDCRFVFTSRGLVYIQRGTGSTRLSDPAAKPVLLKADIQTRKVPNNSGHGMKELIRDVKLEVRQGTLVALLGPSGAGKSTVMNCLNGMETQGMEGTVLFNGEDLVKNFDRLKYLIGSVPQSSVFHKVLTPEAELRDAAVLRLPGDTSRQDIENRVNEVLKKLKLEAVRKTQIAKLSGGEQRRMNIAIELVADRALWCLDEPDAGLDPQTKRELFSMLRDLAHNDNKSILTIIHDVSEIDMFDQVIMLAKKDNVGRLAFSGSPAEGKAYFGTELKNAYAILEREPEKYINN